MAIYQRHPIAVVDDSIYEDLTFYKSLLGNKEFSTGLDKIKLIALSDLSAAIPADRIDDFGVYFYLFECINSSEEYNRYCNLLRKSPNIENVLLFCQNRNASFDISDNDNCRIFNFGIICDPYEQNELACASDTRQHTERCLKLLAVLTALCSVEDRAYSSKQIAVYAQLNYEAIYYAVRHRLLGFSDELSNHDRQIAEYKVRIETLQDKKKFLYSCKSFSELPDIEVPDIDISIHHPEDTLRALGVAFSESEEQLDKLIDSDIHTVRRAMEETDSTIGKDTEPLCLNKSNPDLHHPVPTSNDLLRKTPSDLDTNTNLNISEAIIIARNFLNFEKPKLGKFLLMSACCILLFLITTGSVYLTNILNNPTVQIDRQTLLLVLLIPAGLVLLSALVGFIINKIDYGKIKKILKEIAAAVRVLKSNVLRIISQVREYLNTFITVFYNYHTRDYCIALWNKQIHQLENEKKQIIQGMGVYNTLCDLLKEAYEETQAAKAKENKEDSVRNLDPDNLYGISFDSDDSYLVSSRASESVAEQTHICNITEKCKNADECTDFITNHCDTHVTGNEGDSFCDITVPWIQNIAFDVRGKGGKA